MKRFKSQEERAKTLNRIQKLLATSHGTPYEGEANTALRMAQKFMKTYGLSLTEVELAKDLEESITDVSLSQHTKRANPEYWEVYLSRAVAHVFDCKMYVSKGWDVSCIRFVGFETDVQMAKVVFTCLYIATRSASIKAYPPVPKELRKLDLSFVNSNSVNSSRLSFMFGVACRLYERAQKEKQVAQKEPTGRYGLVVLEKDKRVKNWVDEHLNLSSSKSRKRSLNPDAFNKGKKHANKMDLMNREKVKKHTQLKLTKK